VKTSRVRLDDEFPVAKKRKSLPFQFVVDGIASLAPRTRPMFGGYAVYVGGEGDADVAGSGEESGGQWGVDCHDG
jgi:hypothetical protein